MANQWYYSKNGDKRGPVTGAQLKALAEAGKLRPTDLVWKEGMPSWQPAGKVKGLFPASPPDDRAARRLQRHAPTWLILVAGGVVACMLGLVVLCLVGFTGSSSDQAGGGVDTFIGASGRTSAGKQTPQDVTATNADPRGNLERIWRAWRQCESKTGRPPSEGGKFDKYLREQGEPNAIMKGIGIRWAIDTKLLSSELLIAWQQTSEDGKYYVLFASGKIDQLDEDEVAARGVAVGKQRQAQAQLERDNIRRGLKENEKWWTDAKKFCEEEERKDDAFEKQLNTPEKNPAVEKLRVMRLPEELKELANRREARRKDLEVKRKVYEDTKNRLEAELTK
jgi:hypothetical protein